MPVPRPHGRDPRHLRRPRPLGRGQAAGRAGPAGVQHGPHAGPVDAPRAPRRRARRGRHRHPRTGRVADRDGPPARARPHHRPCAAASRRSRRPARPQARRARARPPSPAVALAGYTNAGKSTLLNAPHRRRGRRPRPPLPHARPDDADDYASTGLPLPRHRHRRLHPQAAPPARRWTTDIESSTDRNWRPPGCLSSVSVRPSVGRMSDVRPWTTCDRLGLVEMWTVSPARFMPASSGPRFPSSPAAKFPPMAHEDVHVVPVRRPAALPWSRSRAPAVC